MTLTSSQLNDADRADLARRCVNLLEAGDVTRFHAEPQITGQSVGLHSWGVCGILIAMGVLIDPEDRWLLGAAVLHDSAERRTGDMPFPTKRVSAEMKATMDKLELTEQMDNQFVITRLSNRQQVLLKLADMLEGLHWCLAGNERRTDVVSQVWTRAIKDLLLEKHGDLREGEAERLWSIFRAVRSIRHPHNGEYSTFAALLQSHEQTLHRHGK